MRKGGGQSLRSYVRKKIFDLVVARLADQGYESVPLGPGYEKSTYLASPFGKLMRLNRDGRGYDAVFIEFMDHDYYTIRIQATILPFKAKSLGGVTLQAGALWPTDAGFWYEYVKHPHKKGGLFGDLGYFSCKRLLGSVRSEHVDRMAAELVAHLQEIDRALNFDIIGPHIRKTDLRRALIRSGAAQASRGPGRMTSGAIRPKPDGADCSASRRV